MDLKAQFNLIAEEYDGKRRKFIPCFDDFYIKTTMLRKCGFQAVECVYSSQKFAVIAAIK